LGVEKAVGGVQSADSCGALNSKGDSWLFGNQPKDYRQRGTIRDRWRRFWQRAQWPPVICRRADSGVLKADRPLRLSLAACWLGAWSLSPIVQARFALGLELAPQVLVDRAIDLSIVQVRPVFEVLRTDESFQGLACG
jgi:hypothetical protein